MSFAQEIQKNGYIFIEDFETGKSLREAANALGVSHNEHDTELKPATREAKNSYSGLYGLGAFPLHTDCAHWLEPPRYILLRCVVGSPDVSTVLVDSRPITEDIGPRALRKILVRPRRPHNGYRRLMSLLDIMQCGMPRIRWDEVFIEPASQSAREGFEHLRDTIKRSPKIAIALKNPGDTLIIDNWRILHGRSEIVDGSQNRTIRRAYLKEIECNPS